MRRKEKDKINILMNVDNYLGEHQGRLAPMILYLCVCAVPIFLYGLFFARFLSFTFFVLFEVLFAGRMALLILGKEKEKLKVYLQAKNDEFASANDLVRVSYVQEDGLIEYMNGEVAYVISAFTTTYTKDNVLSVDLEEFIQGLQEYEFDLYCHLVVDEYRLQDNLEGVCVYTDKKMMQERVQFYVFQDKYCSEKSKLYRFNFVIKAPKSGWKKLRKHLDSITNSGNAKVFKECCICDRTQVSDVMSRDLCAYIDLEEMLKNKYANDNYFGSSVLFYGDEPPEEYKENPEYVGMKGRRVVMKETEGEDFCK